MINGTESESRSSFPQIHLVGFDKCAKQLSGGRILSTNGVETIWFPYGYK